VKIVISTDAHSTGNLSLIEYGVRTARRGWIEPGDVLNTLPCEKLLAALRRRPGAGGEAEPVHAGARSGTGKRSRDGGKKARRG
jgi:hypothetical protein